MKWCLGLLTCFLFVSFGSHAQNTPIKICVVHKGELKEIDAIYTATGDTTVVVDGKTKFFREVYGKGEYAGGKKWYINNESVVIGSVKYVKYGLPRILLAIEVTKAGVYKEVPYFKEAGFSGIPEVIYVPVVPGCEFQPYIKEL